jgi:hypothetical protein
LNQSEEIRQSAGPCGEKQGIAHKECIGSPFLLADSTILGNP